VISYVIRTNYSREREFLETYNSIMRQIGDKEIIVVGILHDPDIWDIIYIEDAKDANTGQTSRMRDIGITEAKGEYIVCMDDDIILSRDFQENITDDDVQIPACNNLRGGRFWDWCVIDHPELKHMKAPYDFPYCEYSYLSGQCFILKAGIDIKHDYDRTFHDKDDVAYGKKLQDAGYEFRCNDKCVCMHNDPRYVDYADGKGILSLG